MTLDVIAVADGIHLARTPLVNWTLVADDTGVLLIDAGFPGQRAEVLASLERLGFGPADVTAILLTHAHIDHLGTAIWFARTHRTPVYCHREEVGHVRRDYLQQASPADLVTQAWRPRWLAWSAEVALKGGLVRDGIPTVKPFSDEVAAQLPGRPVAVPTPGHTSGHCSYLLGGVLVVGDALITGHPLARRPGPQLLPSMFNHDDDACLRSLDVLAASGARVLLPGHGPVWAGPVADAVRQARSYSSSHG
ncbi:MAG: MBL fold metallo-hydrolase [Mycobacterium sp.]|nr:MBL fold metallo-hydrolase [Mycobacterium sp.]